MRRRCSTGFQPVSVIGSPYRPHFRCFPVPPQRRPPRPSILQKPARSTPLPTPVIPSGRPRTPITCLRECACRSHASNAAARDPAPLRTPPRHSAPPAPVILSTPRHPARRSIAQKAERSLPSNVVMLSPVCVVTTFRQTARVRAPASLRTRSTRSRDLSGISLPYFLSAPYLFTQYQRRSQAVPRLCSSSVLTTTSEGPAASSR